MPKYFIEVPHEAEEMACIEAVQAFLNSGSHFLSNADWGCLDGDHKAWMILDLDDKEEAHFILPSSYRQKAKIVKLNKFTLEEIDELYEYHRSKSSDE
jgi:hypothetical protein